MENKHDCFFDGDSTTYKKATKKQKAVGALLKAKDKINDAVYILSTAIHSGILDSHNSDIMSAQSSLQTAKTCVEKELSDLWENKTPAQKENVPSSVLGHP
jgi:hypothetical protein